ncbi:MAG: flavin-containing monooxygenase, partial [Alphaproteobacteria bacterium]
MAQAAIQDYDDQALDFEIVIIGAGFSGIGTGIRLLKNGFGDFVILEKAESAGGTWRDNTYPGLAVDVPTLSYSYSFEQNPHWSNLYAPGPELKAYADHCVNKYGVRPHMRYGVEVTKTVYDEARNVWVTHTATGQTFTSRYIVSATGFLTLPKMPDVPGLDKFKGKVIHTSRWDHSYDFKGKKVGWIGTG